MIDEFDSQASFSAAAPDFSQPLDRDEEDEVTIRDASGLRPPNMLNLVYMRFDETGQFIVRQLSEEFHDSVQASEGRLFTRAHRDRQYDKVNFNDMVWRAPCYLSFVIANDTWKFYWRNQDRRHNPIRFFRRKNKVPPTSRIYGENYSFYDAERFTMGPYDGFRCINFVRDQRGPLRRGQDINYCFQIYLEAPFLHPGSDRHIVILIDPDGQNQGPRT